MREQGLFRLKMAELTNLLNRLVIRKLNSFNGLIGAKVQLWERIRARVIEENPTTRWRYTLQKNEWESHPLQRYIKLIESRIPLPDLPSEMEKLTPDEINEYLIWKGENNRWDIESKKIDEEVMRYTILHKFGSVKDWRRYGKVKKGETKLVNIEKGSRAYVPKGKN